MDGPPVVTVGGAKWRGASGASTPRLGLLPVRGTQSWRKTWPLNVPWRKAWVYVCEPTTSKPPLGSGTTETEPEENGNPLSLVPSPQLTVAVKLNTSAYGLRLKKWNRTGVLAISAPELG